MGNCTGRFTDRIGKGVRTSSRDALIADSVTAEERGKDFGLHRAMNTAGVLWDNVSTAAPFFFGAGLALVALTGIMTFVKEYIT